MLKTLYDVIATVEGGADSWSRPPLRKIDSKKETIIFQQIDVENSTDYSQGGTTLRMFGVTEVRGASSRVLLALISGLGRSQRAGEYHRVPALLLHRSASRFHKRGHRTVQVASQCERDRSSCCVAGLKYVLYRRSTRGITSSGRSRRSARGRCGAI